MKRTTSDGDAGAESPLRAPGGRRGSPSRFGPPAPLNRTTPPRGLLAPLVAKHKGEVVDGAGVKVERVAALPPAGLPSLFSADRAPATPGRRRRKPDKPRQSVLF